MIGLNRRGFLLATGAGLVGGAGRARAAGESMRAAWARIEAGSGGRLGVARRDLADGTSLGHRADERFPLCSLAKLLICAAILARVDQGREDPARRIRFGSEALVAYSPVTGPQAGGDGVTLDALCAAAMIDSDNTAANLLVAALGGPAAVTDFARGLGDGVTRLDRWEPDLNQAGRDDPRDTTSPAALAADLERLAFGAETLSASSRARLLDWMRACRTGGARIRAGLPTGWSAGDKTGSGENGTSNDIAVIFPPGRAPIILAVTLTGSPLPPEGRDAVLAAVAAAATA
ncbi:class A beta-lactamase [Phaeospirillum tilakii]|uniref:beta-lactamase n=1 Tax=Phaeospirillum tilakii TaxID=741673 RepID=A0ABW5C9H7_9PROT